MLLVAQSVNPKTITSLELYDVDHHLDIKQTKKINSHKKQRPWYLLPKNKDYDENMLEI